MRYAEISQGEIPGISRGDEFLLEPYVAPEKPVDKRSLELFTQMIYLEAGTCSFEEKIAVGYTAINRMNIERKKELERVIKKPFQYSCFNNLSEEDIISKRELAKKYDPVVWEECEDIAEKILQEEYLDPTNGATHYYNPRIIQTPKWKMNKLEEIGKIKTKKGYSKHIFFKEKPEEVNFSPKTYQPSS